ncbi:MAG TPA: SsrA-binding protein SmpB [Fimbriimonas sp.]|nr:SsrA-binding protein SmpB [Fimbriimonas sp.]
MASKKNAKGPVQPAKIENRRARFDYHILEDFEAGIALVGSEVKSIFLGHAHLTDAYCQVIGGELYLLGMDVEPYDKASAFGHDRRRDRKLLMHRQQIDLLQRRAQEKGLTIVPLRVYFNDRGKVKVRIGLARGKATYDKREQIAKDDARREIERSRSFRD